MKASVRKHPDSPYWQAVLWVKRADKWIRTNRSTKKTNRDEAIIVALRMQKDIESCSK